MSAMVYPLITCRTEKDYRRKQGKLIVLKLI
jgi:hypothetical protein